MARTDDDSWDITESVGATALGVAMARADEAASERPLFIDPYAQLFHRRGHRPRVAPPFDDATLAESVRTTRSWRSGWRRCGLRRLAHQVLRRLLHRGGRAGVRQAVILAAGLDARAWRLPWMADTVVYEIDQPQGARVQDRDAARPQRHDRPPATSRFRSICARTGRKRCATAGFDADEPTAWSAEGLLPYLPATPRTCCSNASSELSAPDSRIAVEAFGRIYVRRPDRSSRCAAAGMQDMPDAVNRAPKRTTADVPSSSCRRAARRRVDRGAGHRWRPASARAGGRRERRPATRTCGQLRRPGDQCATP